MARSGASKSLVARVTREGWASLADVDDLLYLSDHRVDGLRGTMPVRAWCEALKMPLRKVYREMYGRALAFRRELSYDFRSGLTRIVRQMTMRSASCSTLTA